MADPKLLAILEEGVDEWNRWALAHAKRLWARRIEFHADFAEADLRGANLGGVRLRYAVLRRANLWHAFISDADLTGADLTGANLDDVFVIGDLPT